MTGSDLIVFVMARGGSTRIPLKNIAMLGKRPILSFTLQDVAELQHEFPDLTCVLMTDHPAIKEAAALDPYRPDHFEIVQQSPEEAADMQEFIGLGRVLLEKELAGNYFKYVMMLGADHVVRSQSLLRDAYCEVQQLVDPGLIVQSVVQVPIRYHPHRVVTINPESEQARPWPIENGAFLSQNYPKCYALTGGVFALQRSLIGLQGLQATRRLHALVTEHGLEVDTEADLAEAQALFA